MFKLKSGASRWRGAGLRGTDLFVTHILTWAEVSCCWIVLFFNSIKTDQRPRAQHVSDLFHNFVKCALTILVIKCQCRLEKGNMNVDAVVFHADHTSRRQRNHLRRCRSDFEISVCRVRTQRKPGKQNISVGATLTGLCDCSRQICTISEGTYISASGGTVNVNWKIGTVQIFFLPLMQCRTATSSETIPGLGGVVTLLLVHMKWTTPMACSVLNQCVTVRRIEHNPF